MCVNIKALVSEINQITLKSCYKKSFNQKIYIFFVSLVLWVWSMERIQFDKLCHLYSSIYSFFFSIGMWHFICHRKSISFISIIVVVVISLRQSILFSVYERAYDRMWASEWTTEIWLEIKALNEFIIRMYFFPFFSTLFSLFIPLVKAVLFF